MKEFKISKALANVYLDAYQTHHASLKYLNFEKIDMSRLYDSLGARNGSVYIIF